MVSIRIYPSQITVHDLSISSKVRAMPSGDIEKLACITSVIQTQYKKKERKFVA